MQCSSCNFNNRPGVRFCENCGASLAAAAAQSATGKSCTSCGQALRAGVRFCENCGTPVVQAAPVRPAPANKSAAALGWAVIMLCCGVAGLFYLAENGSSRRSSSYDPPSNTSREGDYSPPESIPDESTGPEYTGPSSDGSGSQGAASVRVSPASASPDQEIVITVTGFQPEESFDWFLGTSANPRWYSGYGEVDGDGQRSFSAPLSAEKTPNGAWEPGSYEVIVEGLNGSVARTTFTVVGGTVAEGVSIVEFTGCPFADVFLTPEGGRMDRAYKLCLAGFEPQETVHVVLALWFPPLHGGPFTQLEFDVQMSRLGTAAVAFIPDAHDLDAGLYLITAQGNQSNRSVSTQSIMGIDLTASIGDYTSDVENARSIAAEFWADNFPALFPDRTYVEPTFIRADPPYTCPGTDKTWTRNATSCSAALMIIWDDVWMRGLYDQYGPAIPFFFMGHEWGHQIQSQSGIMNNLVGKEIELGADCFSGAAFAYAEEQYGALIPDDVYIASYAMRYFGDAEYVDWGVAEKDLNGDGEPDLPHGTMYERFEYFLDGYLNGAQYCVYGY